MSSDEELKEIEALGKEIAKKMGFDDLDLTIVKDKTGTVDVMMVHYSPLTIHTIPKIIKNTIERIRDRIAHLGNYRKLILNEPVKLTLGKKYRKNIEENLAHEFGHVIFGRDHPFLYSILYYFSIPYTYPNRKLKEDKKFYYTGAYSMVASALSVLCFPYGIASYVPFTAHLIQECTAEREAIKRGLKRRYFV